MPISFKSKLSSAAANATFYDKTQDDATIGRLDLTNVELESGDSVVNIQRQINRNTIKPVAAQVITTNDDITLDAISMNQYRRLISVGGAQDLNVLPFGITVQPLDGSTIIVVGTSDTDTVKVSFNDSQYGVLTNGDATLLKGYMLTLIYDGTLERYIEQSRNF